MDMTIKIIRVIEKKKSCVARKSIRMSLQLGEMEAFHRNRNSSNWTKLKDNKDNLNYFSCPLVIKAVKMKFR